MTKTETRVFERVTNGNPDGVYVSGVREVEAARRLIERGHAGAFKPDPIRSYPHYDDAGNRTIRVCGGWLTKADSSGTDLTTTRRIAGTASAP